MASTLDAADLLASYAIMQIHGTHATGLADRLLTASHQQGGHECQPGDERPAETKTEEDK